jgi:hypothetical protein
MDNKGAALQVLSSAGGAAASEFPYQIPANGAMRFVTDGSPSSVNVGWAQLVPTDGSTPVGAGAYGFTTGGILVTESGVPAAVSTTHARIYIDMTNGHDTGLAVVNTSGGLETFTFAAFNPDGLTPATASTGTGTLPANGHDAEPVSKLIPGGIPQGFSGVLDISSSAPFAALTMRSLINSRGDYLLTTFPTADATRQTPAPIVFPQIAAGGGYQTEFVLLSTSGAVAATLGYLGDDGLPLSIGPGSDQSTNYTQSGGTVTKTNETYVASATDASGVLVTNAGVFTLSNSRITTTGNSSNVNNSSQYGTNAGVLANSGGKVTIAVGAVSTSGSGANGLFATGSGSSISMSNGTITATGGNAHGVDVTYGGTVTLTNVNVTTSGASSSAVATDFGGGTVNVTGGTIIAGSTSANSHSAAIYSTGSISVSGATATSRGDNGSVIDGANSISLTNTTLMCALHGFKLWKTAPTSGTATVTIQGGSVTAAGGDAFYITGETGNGANGAITVKGGATISASTGNIMNVISSSTGSFTADGVTLTGNLVADTTSTLTVTLQNQTTLQGIVQRAAMTMDSTSVWHVTGNSNLTNVADASGISGLTITNIIGNGFNVYYDATLAANKQLGGLTYSLVNGGHLMPK